MSYLSWSLSFISSSCITCVWDSSLEIPESLTLSNKLDWSWYVPFRIFISRWIFSICWNSSSTCSSRSSVCASWSTFYRDRAAFCEGVTHALDIAEVELTHFLVIRQISISPLFKNYDHKGFLTAETQVYRPSPQNRNNQPRTERWRRDTAGIATTATAEACRPAYGKVWFSVAENQWRSSRAPVAAKAQTGDRLGSELRPD